MYLVSLYFDDKSERKIQGLINKVAEKSGNNFMTYNNVPPHTTIAKKLTKEELMLGFQELDNNFTVFSGTITRIGLSRTNPLEDIVVWNLDNN